MLNDDRYCREHPNGGYYVTVGRNAKIIFRSSSGANIKHSGFNLSIEAIGKYLTINPKINIFWILHHRPSSICNKIKRTCPYWKVIYMCCFMWLTMYLKILYLTIVYSNMFNDTKKIKIKLNDDVSKRQVSFSKTAIIFIVHQFRHEAKRKECDQYTRSDWASMGSSGKFQKYFL